MNTIFFAIFLLIGMVMNTNSFADEPAFLTPQSKRITLFKERLAFSTILSREQKKVPISVDWMKLLPPPELSGWQVQEHGVTSNSDGSKIIFVWEFKNGEENSLTIQARTCKTVENAANYFLNTADSTTTTEIPYIKGPEELGAVSAVDGQDGTSYFWFYKNVFIKVTKYPKSKVSALHIALWVQKELEASQIEPRRGQ